MEFTTMLLVMMLVLEVKAYSFLNMKFTGVETAADKALAKKVKKVQEKPLSFKEKTGFIFKDKDGEYDVPFINKPMWFQLVVKKNFEQKICDYIVSLRNQSTRWGDAVEQVYYPQEAFVKFKAKALTLGFKAAIPCQVYIKTKMDPDLCDDIEAIEGVYNFAKSGGLVLPLSDFEAKNIEYKMSNAVRELSPELQLMKKDEYVSVIDGDRKGRYGILTGYAYGGRLEVTLRGEQGDMTEMFNPEQLAYLANPPETKWQEMTAREAVESLMLRNPYDPLLKSLKKDGTLEEILYPEGRPEGSSFDGNFGSVDRPNRRRGREETSGREAGPRVRSISADSAKRLDKTDSKSVWGSSVRGSAESATDSPYGSYNSPRSSPASVNVNDEESRVSRSRREKTVDLDDWFGSDSDDRKDNDSRSSSRGSGYKSESPFGVGVGLGVGVDGGRGRSWSPRSGSFTSTSTTSSSYDSSDSSERDRVGGGQKPKSWVPKDYQPLPPMPMRVKDSFDSGRGTSYGRDSPSVSPGLSAGRKSGGTDAVQDDIDSFLSALLASMDGGETRGGGNIDLPSFEDQASGDSRSDGSRRSGSSRKDRSGVSSPRSPSMVEASRRGLGSASRSRDSDDALEELLLSLDDIDSAGEKKYLTSDESSPSVDYNVGGGYSDSKPAARSWSSSSSTRGTGSRASPRGGADVNSESAREKGEEFDRKLAESVPRTSAPSIRDFESFEEYVDALVDFQRTSSSSSSSSSYQSQPPPLSPYPSSSAASRGRRGKSSASPTQPSSPALPAQSVSVDPASSLEASDFLPDRSGEGDSSYNLEDLFEPPDAPRISTASFSSLDVEDIEDIGSTSLKAPRKKKAGDEVEVANAPFSAAELIEPATSPTKSVAKKSTRTSKMSSKSETQNSGPSPSSSVTAAAALTSDEVPVTLKKKKTRAKPSAVASGALENSDGAINARPAQVAHGLSSLGDETAPAVPVKRKRSSKKALEES